MRYGSKLLAAALLLLSTACHLNRPNADASEPDRLRVLTYNVLYVFDHGKEVETGSAWIREQAPDIVALQELTNISPERLEELASGWGHEHSALLKTSGFSVGLTSRHPIEVLESIEGDLHHGCLHARVEGIHFFVVHLSPFRWEVRQREADLLLPRIEPLLEQGRDVLVLGDFNALSPADRALLEAQPELLAKHRASDAEHAHVENLRDDHFDYSVMERFLDAGLQDAVLPFIEASDASRWTFPTGIWSEDKATAPTGGSRIDFILASPSVASTVAAAAIPREGVVNRTSDHYPVLVDVLRRSAP
ncbi:MAG: endonuclease/exonuclease/phosphatase family protein [Planctomycetota bacterium]|jgi:exodeoxyribonuclease-3